MSSDAHDHAPEAHDLGLQHDLTELSEQRSRAWGRRGLLGLMGGLGVAAVAGCATDDSGTADGGSASTTTSSTGEIPEEAAGPFPGDGSNGPNVLSESGIVRSDIRTSLGSASGVAGGVPTRVRLRVYDLSGDDITPLAGGAIYLWHCDREGRYSMYSEGATDENYLRGVQEADADGWLEFTTIFPACYAGRWPHMHFEVYESLTKATNAEHKLRTSQLALPEDVCREVYDNAEGYEQSVTNLAQLSLDTDGIFSDGYSLQLARVSGSVDEGYTVTLNVPV